MSHYSYQYKQQCVVPCRVKLATPAFSQCQQPCAGQCVPCAGQCVPCAGQCAPCAGQCAPCSRQCVSCAPCTSKGAKLYAVRKPLQSISPCSTPCSSGCVEIVERSSTSPCSPTSPPPPCCLARGPLCLPHCGQQSLPRCPQPCAPTPVCQHSSYQWSNCYHYRCGQQ